VSTVVITGASRGLGKELAIAFARKGFNLGLVSRSDSSGLEATTCECLKSDVKVLHRLCDVGDTKKVEEFVRDVLNKNDTLDLLINNAGIAHYELLNRTSNGKFDEVIKTNLTGQMNCIRAAAKYMMKQRTGHIINIGSLSAIRGIRGGSAYSASKRGLVGLTQSAAAEFGRFDIKVNMVMPGYLPTEMTRGMTKEQVREMSGKNTLGHPSTFDEVCRFIVHLADMRNVSGQIFNLDSRISIWS